MCLGREDFKDEILITILGENVHATTVLNLVLDDYIVDQGLPLVTMPTALIPQLPLKTPLKTPKKDTISPLLKDRPVVSC